MSFTQQFTIVNNTGFTLVLDLVGSDNLGDGEWPTSVAPHTTTPAFKQTGFFSVNPTAVYQFQGASPANTAYLHFYCVGVDPALHVNMTMASSGAFVAGSSIKENNTDNGHSWTTDSSNPLEISTTGNGSSRGEAVFTIGS
jgi:hypothetical protein